MPLNWAEPAALGLVASSSGSGASGIPDIFGDNNRLIMTIPLFDLAYRACLDFARHDHLPALPG
jgi:hypothetical protein